MTSLRFREFVGHKHRCANLGRWDNEPPIFQGEGKHLKAARKQLSRFDTFMSPSMAKSNKEPGRRGR